MFRAWREDRPFRHQDVQQVVVRQIYFTGLQAFRLVALAAIILGTLTVAQSASQLSRIGGSDAIGNILIGAFFREIGPLIVLVVVVARSVTAITSELASMKASGEIDGIRGVGVSPLSYLVVPRIVGGAIATLLLAMHFVWIAFTVGFFVLQFYVQMPWSRYLDNIITSIGVGDFVVFFTKTFSLAVIIFVIACYCGLRTTGANYEIPQATTRAVVWCFMFCFITQVLISFFYYFLLFQDSFLGSLL